MTQLNARGEVADILNVSQFVPSRSAYECVAYSAALCKYAGQPGHGPTGTALQASNLAQYWYGKEEGSNLSSNTNGMSLQAEYDMLKGMTLTFHEVASDVNAVKSWLQRGYPLMICGAETGMHDVELGDRVPYSWTPTGNHCIVATGIAPDGNLLVHDCASIGPNGVRPGPRTYDAAKLQLISATAVDMPWLGGNMSLPPGWHDDGTTLSTASGELVLGFRAHVLSLLLAGKWNPANQPLGKQYYTKQLEASNPLLGDGDQIILTEGMLGYPHNPQAPYEGLKNKVIEEYVGTELDYTRKQVAKYYAAATQAQAQVAQLQAQLAQLQQPNPDALAAIHQVQQVVAPFK